MSRNYSIEYRIESITDQNPGTEQCFIKTNVSFVSKKRKIDFIFIHTDKTINKKTDRFKNIIWIIKIIYNLGNINYNQINSEQGVKYSVLPDTCVQ